MDACLGEEEERGGIIKDPSALGTDWLVLYHFWETPTLGSHAHTRSPQKRPDIPKQKAKTLFYGLENEFQRERKTQFCLGEIVDPTLRVQIMKRLTDYLF